MKKIAILGFGMEGKDAAKYFAGEDITVFDKKPKEEIAKDEWADANINWMCGENYLDDGIKGFDVVVRSPGFYRYQKAIVDAESEGATITSNTILFFQNSKAPIIGVTGTKGKGTTSTLISKLLEANGKKVLLAGNIGEAMLSLLPQTTSVDWVVLELSSFQIIDLPISPKITVVTNISSDHMDWHKDQEEYEKAKENLWIHQSENDFLVLNWHDKTSRRLVKSAKAKVLWFSSTNSQDATACVNSKWKMDQSNYDLNEKNEVFVNNENLGTTDRLKIPGRHNLENVLAAMCTSIAANLDLKTSWDAACKFEGLEHRLEKVAEINGVLFINDSFATNPEPTLAAIRSYSKSKVLILGGSTKGADFTNMAEQISNNNVKGTVLIGDEAAKIEEALKKANFKGVVKSGLSKMPEVVKAASEIANPGEVVILSPACASFGLFKDYKDRGKQFKEAVKNLA